MDSSFSEHISGNCKNMETYLRRTYAKKMAMENDDFPFWDYRSRRGVLTCSSSSISSSRSSSDGSSISSVSSRSETGSENASLLDHSDTDSLLPWEQHKMTIQFQTDTNEIPEMEKVYQPIVNWIDSDLHILKITDKSDCYRSCRQMTSLPNSNAQIPGMAIMLFLHEEGLVGFERIQTLKRHFEKSPWKFHHSEQVHRQTINPYPYNSQDFYYTSEDLPLWAVRQVHTGKEFFRTVLFVSESSWQTMMQFYKLILGGEPDVKRDDFCLFTVSCFTNFDVQLALKKLKVDTKPRILESVRLQFIVKDVGNILSLLPNLCRPLSDNRWETSDNEGNIVVLETPRSPSNSTFGEMSQTSDSSSISDRSSFSRRNVSRRNDINLDSVYTRQLVETTRFSASQPQRSRSLIGNDALVQKIKNENMLFRQNTMNAIKGKHLDMERHFPGREGTNNVADQSPEVSGDSDSVNSFYV